MLSRARRGGLERRAVDRAGFARVGAGVGDHPFFGESLPVLNMKDPQRIRNQSFDRWLGVAAIGLTSCAQYGGDELPRPDSRPHVSESATSCEGADAPAKTISWRGYTWEVIKGGMAGVAQADPNNVFVDANGYLHLRIRKQGNTWTAAEM